MLFLRRLFAKYPPDDEVLSWFPSKLGKQKRIPAYTTYKAHNAGRISVEWLLTSSNMAYVGFQINNSSKTGCYAW